MRFFYACFLRNLQLRVVANSDSAEDQQTKLRVRSAVLPVARQEPLNLPRIAEAARSICPSAKARLAFYPPARPRPTVIIRLGSGHGHNWLGMLFPDLFGLPEGEPVRFRFLLAELFRGWF